MQNRQQQALNANRPLWRVLGVAVLGAALGVPAAPAQASEVVKLARLLITGKRQPSRPPAPQPAPPDRGTESSAQPQTRASDVELHAQTPRRSADGSGISMD